MRRRAPPAKHPGLTSPTQARVADESSLPPPFPRGRNAQGRQVRGDVVPTAGDSNIQHLPRLPRIPHSDLARSAPPGSETSLHPAACAGTPPANAADKWDWSKLNRCTSRVGLAVGMHRGGGCPGWRRRASWLIGRPCTRTAKTPVSGGRLCLRRMLAVGIADLAAELVAAHDPAGDGVGPAQQSGPPGPCRRPPGPRARRCWRRAGRRPRRCAWPRPCSRSARHRP
jgi:hypothetical protein